MAVSGQQQFRWGLAQVQSFQQPEKEGEEKEDTPCFTTLITALSPVLDGQSLSFPPCLSEILHPSENRHRVRVQDKP